MTFTKVEVPNLSSVKKVAIRAFFNPNKENMGLEKYNMTLHEGVYHTEQLACLENNGIKRYLTGLNEFAPEIKRISDPELRSAKIKDIRTTVAQLEKDLAANVIDPEDEQFWNKVQILRPDNSEFWDKIELKAGNTETYLDPQNNPYDLIKLYAIEAGGFSMIAKSYEEAQKLPVDPKFYLDKQEETVSTKNIIRKLRNKAAAELQALYDKDSNKLLYVTKVLDPGSASYRKSTSNDALYEAMDNYIQGLSFEHDKKRAAQTFLDTANQSVADLKMRAMVKDATYFKVITPKADGYIYHTATSTMLGRNVADIVEYLKNPLNEQILVEIQDAVEEEWNK